MLPDILCFMQRKTKSKINIHSTYILLIMLFFSIAIFSACDKNVANPMPRREVSVYSERTISAVSPYKLCIECDYGNLEFYNWDRKEVKFEITNKVRVGGTEDERNKMLEKFKINALEESGKISFICNYNGKGGNYQDTLSVVRIFIPGKPSSLECKLKQGRFNFFDDLACDLELDVGNAEVEINRLKGVIKYTGTTGNLRISSGELNTNSSIITSTGNIRIKTDFESPGSYTFKTGAGVIELNIPKALNAVFENNDKNNLNENNGSQAYSKFLLKCGMGKIDINRF